LEDKKSLNYSIARLSEMLLYSPWTDEPQNENVTGTCIKLYDHEINGDPRLKS